MQDSNLQQELKRKQPFGSTEQEAVLSILRTSDQFLNRFGRLFRESGLTSSQFNVLRILRGEGKPLPCQEISSRMIQVVPAMTGLIDRLEAQQLVRRNRCTADRRVVYIEITEAGLQLLKKLDKPVRDLEKDLLRHLDPKEIVQLTRLLNKARRSLAEDSVPS